MHERTKWLAAALHWLLAGMGLIVALAGAATLAMGMTAWLSPDFRAKIMSASMDEGVSADIRARIADGSLFGMMAAGLLLAGLLLWLLWRIIGRVRKGDPFAPENSRDIYYVAGLMAALEVGGWIVSEILPIASYCRAGDDGFDATGLLSVLMAVVLAEVFREGTRLRDDVAGTV